MRLFGLTITRDKDVGALQVPGDRGGWWPVVREPFAGAWQRNVEVRRDTVLTYGAVYACITRISSDIGKLRVKLVEWNDRSEIWSEVSVPAFSPVLTKPNHYQNRIQFIQQWISSKLIHGNTYVLKGRDGRGVVTELYVLDPTRTKVLVGAEDGSVYYELAVDNLSGVNATVTVPASEVIHDTMNALYHPLVGISPITACGLAAMQGVNIQNNSAKFFGNASIPSGVLTAPATIAQPTADRLKADWQQNFSGANYGKTAVLGDGLKYETIGMKAVDAQLIEQLKWTAENVCTAFAVPAFMVGVGAPPTYNNIEALNQQYYSQCLQILIESLELALDEGLGLVNVAGHAYGSELDLDGLLRMDTATQVIAIRDAVGAGVMAPNEGRKKLDLKPVRGGDVPYLQNQNFSLEALAKRDALEDPFASKTPPALPPPPPAIPAAGVPPPAKAMSEPPADWASLRAVMKAAA